MNSKEAQLQWVRIGVTSWKKRFKKREGKGKCPFSYHCHISAIRPPRPMCSVFHVGGSIGDKRQKQEVLGLLKE